MCLCCVHMKIEVKLHIEISWLIDVLTRTGQRSACNINIDRHTNTHTSFEYYEKKKSIIVNFCNFIHAFTFIDYYFSTTAWMIRYYPSKGWALKMSNSLHLTNGLLSESSINPSRGTRLMSVTMQTILANVIFVISCICSKRKKKTSHDQPLDFVQLNTVNLCQTWWEFIRICWMWIKKSITIFQTIIFFSNQTSCNGTILTWFETFLK